MPESSEPVEQTKATRAQYQDVFDAVQMAFWNEPFMSCRQDELPEPLWKDECRYDSRMRIKKDFDSVRECSVQITHYKYLLFVDEAFVPKEYVDIQWNDEVRTLYSIDLVELEMGYFALTEQTDQSNKLEYSPFQHDIADFAKDMAKIAMGEITTISES